MSGRLSISDHSSGRWGRIAACMFTRCTLNCRGVENCSNVEFVNENHSYRELQFFFLNKTSLSPFCLVPEFSQYTQSWIAGRRKRLLLHRALAPPDRLPRRVHSHVDLSHFGLSVPLPAPAMHIKRRCVPQRPDCFFFFFFFFFPSFHSPLILLATPGSSRIRGVEIAQSRNRAAPPTPADVESDHSDHSDPLRMNGTMRRPLRRWRSCSRPSLRVPCVYGSRGPAGRLPSVKLHHSSALLSGSFQFDNFTNLQPLQHCSTDAV